MPTPATWSSCPASDSFCWPVSKSQSFTVPLLPEMMRRPLGLTQMLETRLAWTVIVRSSFPVAASQIVIASPPPGTMDLPTALRARSLRPDVRRRGLMRGTHHEAQVPFEQ
jgi:hypothetical protein